MTVLSGQAEATRIPMDEPRQSAKPEFNRASGATDDRDPVNAWRREQIAALTPEQRREYNDRVQDEARKSDERRRQLDAQKRQSIQTEKQSILSGRNSFDLNTPQRMRDPGRHRRAESLAVGRVEDRIKAEMERVRMEGDARLDGYLQQAERERREQAAERGRRDFNFSARDPSLKRAIDRARQRREQHGREQDRQEFNASARDPSLKRAFVRARQRQEQRGQEQDRTRETTPGRTDAANKPDKQRPDESLKRAFERAKQRQRVSPENTNEPGR